MRYFTDDDGGFWRYDDCGQMYILVYRPNETYVDGVWTDSLFIDPLDLFSSNPPIDARCECEYPDTEFCFCIVPIVREISESEFNAMKDAAS